MKRSLSSDTAIQYLTWALEELEALGQPKAVIHARMALDELRGAQAGLPSHFDQEAQRFRDKADEAEQLAGLAQTASRRNSLIKIAESYRCTAEQMDVLSVTQAAAKRG